MRMGRDHHRWSAGPATQLQSVAQAGLKEGAARKATHKEDLRQAWVTGQGTSQHNCYSQHTS
jgi:hypothetical protein